MQQSMNTVHRPLTKGAALSAFTVSAYLLLVGAGLLITRRLRTPGLGRILRATLRPPYSGRLDTFRQEQGHCFVATVPEQLLSDRESASRLKLFEDGREVGPAHSGHAEIRNDGGGRYSHWGPELYFSTSDNSDPRHNQRVYEVKEMK